MLALSMLLVFIVFFLIFTFPSPDFTMKISSIRKIWKIDIVNIHSSCYIQLTVFMYFILSLFIIFIFFIIIAICFRSWQMVAQCQIWPRFQIAELGKVLWRNKVCIMKIMHELPNFLPLKNVCLNVSKNSVKYLHRCWQGEAGCILC